MSTEPSRSLFAALEAFEPDQEVFRASNVIHEAFVFPLSFAQQRLWFIEQLEPGRGVYNLPIAYRLRGPLSLVALEQSLNEIVRRHEILRTTFSLLGSEPVQVIAPNLKVKVQLGDFRHLTELSREAERARFVSHESQRPFDLSKGPLLRAGVLRLAEEDHILFLVLHHIVSDGWSIAVLFRELAVLYEAFLQERPSPLPDLPIQYADFAVWQREWLQGEILQTQLSYWRKQLNNIPQMLELPTDRPRPPAQTYKGAEQSLVLSKALTGALYALSRREGVTLFMTLLAAFQVLLYRYTGQEDIVVGAPIANRNQREIEGLIGFFANTVVLRNNISGNPTFRELMGQVREVCLGAYAHQDLPFEKLVEELEPERDLSRNPLFQAMFVLQHNTKLDLELSGLTLTALKIDRGSSKFDLTLELVEKEEELSAVLVYNTDLFDDTRITRMLGQWQTLLESIVGDPGQHLSDLSIVTDEERDQLLVEWNNTKTDYGEKRCIHELFEAQVERTPEAVAVVDENRQLTYRELNQRANQLAHYLRTLGVGPEVLVGICVERSLEMVVGELGILKAGGAFVPFDPDYPKERLAFMLKDAQVRVLLVQQRLAAKLIGDRRSKPVLSEAEGIEDDDFRSAILDLRIEVVCLNTDWEVARENKVNPRSSVRAENLAYVIYTSGSTGEPKGVAIQHAGVVNLMAWLQGVHSVTSTDRATLLASPAFDASVWELWPYLAAGASIHIVDEEILISPPKLLQWLVTKGINICFLPTPLAEAVLEEQWPSGLALRALLTGGDKLHRSPRQTLPFRFVNKYGPTENSAVTTWAPVATGTETDIPPPIGRPIANNQVYLLDRHLNPVPIGVSGELFIGGDGLARGYLNRPELTSEKFIPNPFSDAPGTRLYRTGDLARYLPDGNIEFLGRIDHQVKIRGFRIELGEIEAALGQHPAVREVVVLAREDTGRDKRLVAYVVPDQDLSPSTSELRNFLKNKLPEYMVPSSFVMLEGLPLTANGKVDRSALPAPDCAGPELEGSIVAPSTRVEAMLERIWAEVLKLKQIGVHDNFFEIGGDSILSIQIIARANQAGLRLTPKQFFQHQTIAELAAVAGTTQAIHAEQGMVTGKVPLTPIQHWFFEQEFPEPHHWNTVMQLEVQKACDPALLARVVQHLLWHHDALRLRFTHGESGWQQFNAAPGQAVPFSRVDLSTVSESEQGPVMEATAAQLQSSLNLLEGPLLRVALFELGADKPSRLLIIIHHLAVDGVSWRILLEDLETAYRQVNQGESVQLPPKTTSFKRWAEQLTECAQTAVFQKELDYWLAQPWTRVSALPVDFPEGRPHNTVASARRVSVCLGVEETRALLQEVPEIYHTQINDVLLAALVHAFSRWTGSQWLLVDLEGHGREEIFEGIDLSRTMGWFTTIFPVLLSLGVTWHPGEAMKSIKEQLRRIPNRGIGYGSLRFLSGDAAVAAMLRGLPQPEVCFNYLGQFDQIFTETSLFAWTKDASGPAHSRRGSRRHLLNVDGSVIEGRLRLTWIYSTNLHRHSTIEGLAQAFLDAVQSLITHRQSLDAKNHTHSQERPSDLPLSVETLPRQSPVSWTKLANNSLVGAGTGMISVIPGNDIVHLAIQRRGYSFVLGSTICLSPDIESYWEELRGDWNHLPADAGLKDKGRYRFRRYDRFLFLPVSGELLPLPHTAFFQGKGFNNLHGGIKREFAALRKLTFENIFLRELIKFDFFQFSPESTTIQRPWEVGIHEIRIVAKPAAAGKPTPEGPHRDGYKFIAMHLIKRQNILGGVTTIFDKRKQTLQAVTLLDPLDSVYAEDARVIHDVTPIYLEKNDVRGIRDVLIVTYDYHPRLETE